MNSDTVKKALKTISKIISWAIFIILILVAAFLLYYYIATKIYTAKGPGYEPKYSIYTIVSGSMTPNIKVYDTIINKRVDDPKEIKVGDVITFISNGVLTSGMTTTHRVIAITEDEGEMCFQTKGDANDVQDQTCAKYSNIIGKVILKIPQLGQIQFFLASKAGWLLCILIPALIIIIRDILKIMKLTTIKDTATELTDKKIDSKQKEQERIRKEELKRKLLKEDIKEKDYYKEPEIKTIEKNKNNQKNKKKGKN